jgi:hypothetical protein
MCGSGVKNLAFMVLNSSGIPTFSYLSAFNWRFDNEYRPDVRYNKRRANEQGAV